MENMNGWRVGRKKRRDGEKARNKPSVSSVCSLVSVTVTEH